MQLLIARTEHVCRKASDEAPGNIGAELHCSWGNWLVMPIANHTKAAVRLVAERREATGRRRQDFFAAKACVLLSLRHEGVDCNDG